MFAGHPPLPYSSALPLFRADLSPNATMEARAAPATAVAAVVILETFYRSCVAIRTFKAGGGTLSENLISCFCCAGGCSGRTCNSLSKVTAIYSLLLLNLRHLQ